MSVSTTIMTNILLCPCRGAPSLFAKNTLDETPFLMSSRLIYLQALTSGLKWFPSGHKVPKKGLVGHTGRTTYFVPVVCSARISIVCNSGIGGKAYITLSVGHSDLEACIPEHPSVNTLLKNIGHFLFLLFAYN